MRTWARSAAVDAACTADPPPGEFSQQGCLCAFGVPRLGAQPGIYGALTSRNVF